MEKMKRKVKWDREGVSEVIGTILTLSITVVLFSSIIVMVNQFPAPGDTVHTDFTAIIEPLDNWEDGANVHIINIGGQVMEGMSALIVLTVDSQSFICYTQDRVSNDYGLGFKGPDNGDDNWDTGERWTYHLNKTQVSQTSEVSAIILDVVRNAMVWNGQIQGARNRYGPLISNIRVDTEPSGIGSSPVPFGGTFYLFANIQVKDGSMETVIAHADLSAISLPSDVQMQHMGNGLFRAGPLKGPLKGNVTVGYHIISVEAVNDGMLSRANARISVGMDLELPYLMVRYFESSTLSPRNNDEGTLTVTIVNHGIECLATLTIQDSMGDRTLPGRTLPFSIAAGQELEVPVDSWVFTPGGDHVLNATAEPIGTSNFEYGLHYMELEITVMPIILIVDDDNYNSADYSYRNTVSRMMGALENCDFKYFVHTVPSGSDGPVFYDMDESVTQLSRYDIVIWMTGYEKVKTLTINDQANIEKFLRNDTKPGSLWLIGQYLLNDTTLTTSNFLPQLMKMGSHTDTDKMPEVQGIPGHPISDEWRSLPVPLSLTIPVDNDWSVQPIVDTASSTIAFTYTDDAPDWGRALNYETPNKNDTNLDDFRMVFFPWEFSRINNTADQARVAFRVLNWLGSILEYRAGVDLAVSEQTILPGKVFFNDMVNVTAVIRNNGPINITSEAVLYLDGRDIAMQIFTVPGNGGTVEVSATWKAEELGTHILKWRVNPSGAIVETNYINNEVPDHIHDGKVVVNFRVLVVDDDDSYNNGGGWENDTALLTGTLKRLGYVYESQDGENTEYIVPSLGDGPDIDYLSNYNVVFWVGGNASNALTDNDAVSLMRYLNQSGKLWLSGLDLFDGLTDEISTVLMGKLGLSLESDFAEAISGNIQGVEDCPITHGMNISIADNSHARVLLPGTAIGALYHEGKALAVKHSNAYYAFTNSFSLGTLCGQNSSYIRGANAVDELTYMILRWAGRPETRSELRITEKDYSLSNSHPQIGDAYVLRARVHNVGANSANVLVRFMDGAVQIGADTISVSPGTTTSAEIIWRPLFAGMRTIKILVDPVGDIPEVMRFNNNISFQIYVYFFWDDMESGVGKWSHASRIININGEGKLDYYNSNAQVNIDSEWGSISGVEMVNNSAHSYPNSYYMEEPFGYFGEKADVLVAIVLDNSPSMTDRTCPDGTGRTYQRVAKDAAIGMLNEFSNESAVGVYGFTGANEVVFIGITSLAGTGRQDVIDAIEDIKEDQGNTNTAIWDAIGLGYMAVHNAIPLYPDNFAAVVSLGDGGDYQAADSSAFKEQSLESGSDEWAPWGDMRPELGYPTAPYTHHMGKYWFYKDPLPGVWIDAGTHGGAWKADRKGLLNSDVPTYTIGLALEHYSQPYSNPVTPVPAEYTQDTNTHVTGTESGTIEYNFWRIANTSKAQYFYSEDGSNLEDIFITIGQIISTGGFNQTRSSTPAPETRADIFVDRWAETPTINLTDVEKAQLSFWHRYKIRQGANGGYLEIMLYNQNLSQWQNMYIIPPGKYTGMLFYEYSVNDSFGTDVRWCWNGLSGQGTFGWDYVSVDIMQFLGNIDWNVYDKTQVSVRFYYRQWGGGVTGNGWYIDDVKVDVTRRGESFIDGHRDQWYHAAGFAHSGNYSWGNNIIPGNDNFLTTPAIDLTLARNARLSAHFHFNFNDFLGSPPNGFRVEVTGDGGVTWEALNQGVKTNSTVSGIWVSSDQLALELSLDVDLTAWRGGQIFIRFRVVSNNIASNANAPYYVDDVEVTGDSIYG